MTNQLYDTLMSQIMQIQPNEWITRLRVWCWLMVSLYLISFSPNLATFQATTRFSR